ncbi:hypothetical protein ACFL60_03400 [Candidatus Omnitrophota bacterium]
MKNVMLFVLLCLFSSQVFADSESLLQDGYLGLGAKMTQTGDGAKPAYGFRGGWIVNHSYGVGVGFYAGGKIGAHETGNPGKKRDLAFYHFGVETEYTGAWDRRVHYTIHAHIGFGGLSYTDLNDEKGIEPDVDSSGTSLSFDDGLFIFEPSFNVEINVTKSFRITTGLFYRAVAGVELEGLDNSDIGGPGVSFVVKFGGYR